MTGEFDMLMSICYFARQDTRLKPIAEWIAGKCVAETKGKKEGWDFESWKEKWGKLYDPDDLKWQYLDECHDILDHRGGFHGKVFKPSTVGLIQFIHGFMRGERISKHMLKRQLGKKAAEELLQMMRNSGVEIEEDKYFIRRKSRG